MEAEAAAASSTTKPVEEAVQERNPLIYAYKRDNIIREGDTLVVFEGGADGMKQVTMVKGGILQNKFGAFHHSSIIDEVEYGQKVYSKNMKGFVYMLRPTSHMYTASLA